MPDVCSAVAIGNGSIPADERVQPSILCHAELRRLDTACRLSRSAHQFSHHLQQFVDRVVAAAGTDGALHAAVGVILQQLQ